MNDDIEYQLCNIKELLLKSKEYIMTNYTGKAITNINKALEFECLKGCATSDFIMICPDDRCDRGCVHKGEHIMNATCLSTACLPCVNTTKLRVAK